MVIFANSSQSVTVMWSLVGILFVSLEFTAALFGVIASQFTRTSSLYYEWLIRSGGGYLTMVRLYHVRDSCQVAGPLFIRRGPATFVGLLCRPVVDPDVGQFGRIPVFFGRQAVVHA